MRKSHNKECVEMFRKIIDCYSYHGFKNGKGPLVNLTFFLGSGFSHAWDQRYPLGNSLFELDYDRICFSEKYEFLRGFWDYCGLHHVSIQFDEFVSLYYRLNMMKKHDFLQGRFWDKRNLELVENQVRLYIQESIIQKTSLEFCDENEHFGYNKKNKDIYIFFDKIMSELTGDSGIPEGIRSNFLTTNYDFVIEYILDACHCDELPYYFYSYRGFTPELVNGKTQCIVPHTNQNEHPVIKLNGGLEIYKEGTNYSLEYRKIDAPYGFSSPEIILPCQEQSYDSDYFKMIFPKANRILQESKILFVSGYSFPKEDGLIKFLLKQFAESTRDVKDKMIFYVDYDKNGIEHHLLNRISTVFPEFKDNIFVYTKGFSSFASEFNKLKSKFEI